MARRYNSTESIRRRKATAVDATTSATGSDVGAFKTGAGSGGGDEGAVFTITDTPGIGTN